MNGYELKASVALQLSALMKDVVYNSDNTKDRIFEIYGECKKVTNDADAAEALELMRLITRYGNNMPKEEPEFLELFKKCLAAVQSEFAFGSIPAVSRL